MGYTLNAYMGKVSNPYIGLVWSAKYTITITIMIMLSLRDDMVTLVYDLKWFFNDWVGSN